MYLPIGVINIQVISPIFGKNGYFTFLDSVSKRYLLGRPYGLKNQLSNTDWELVNQFVTVTWNWGPHLRWNKCLHYGGKHSRITLDTCGYLFLGIGHWHTMCPKQDNDFPMFRYFDTMTQKWISCVCEQQPLI